MLVYLLSIALGLVFSFRPGEFRLAFAVLYYPALWRLLPLTCDNNTMYLVRNCTAWLAVAMHQPRWASSERYLKYITHRRIETP